MKTTLYLLLLLADWRCSAQDLDVPDWITAIAPTGGGQSGTVYYVAAAGNDSLDGKTTGTAWATLGKVNGFSFSPGDVVQFNRGDTWTGTLTPSVGGTSGNPLTFTCYGSGALPLINANGAANACLVNTLNYIAIINMQFKNAAGANVEADGCVGNVWSNLYSFNATTANGNGFHGKVNGCTGLIRNCYGYNNVDNGFSQHDTTTWTVGGCVFTNNQNGGIYNINSSTCTVTNTLCASNGVNGIEIDTGSIVGWGNTLYSNANAAFDATSGGYFLMTNCVAWRNKYGAYLNSTASPGSTVVQTIFGTNSSAGIQVDTGAMLSLSNSWSYEPQWCGIIAASCFFTNHWGTVTNSGGFNLNGTFVCTTTIHSGDAAGGNNYAYRVNGATYGLIENCWVNASANYAYRGDTVAYTLQNCVARGTTGGNYSGTVATVRNCIGSDTTFPSGNGNVANANFATYYASTTFGASTFGVVLVSGGAYHTGHAVLGTEATYWDGVTIGTANIGPMGTTQ